MIRSFHMVQKSVIKYYYYLWCCDAVYIFDDSNYMKRWDSSLTYIFLLFYISLLMI